MVNITKIPCPENQYKIKCPYPMTAETVIIHNTYNDASARDEIAYMHRNSNYTSFHFAVDDKEIVQGIDLDRNSFNAGDGANGKGNRTGISIEICYSKSGGERFVKAQENAAELTAYLLKERGWGIDRVSKHQDYSGKHCPHRTLDDYGWDYFLNLVKKDINTGETSEKTLYRVQTGAFTNPDNADVLADKLNSAGFRTYIVRADKLYKVQVGAYSVKENAENMAKELIKSGYDAFITTNGVPASETKPSTPKPTAPAKPASSFFPERGYFKEGDTHANIGKISAFMRRTFPAYTSEKALGNYYGKYLTAAVIEFQRRTELTPDGCTGPITINKLKEFGFKSE